MLDGELVIKCFGKAFYENGVKNKTGKLIFQSLLGLDLQL
jgi:hypothetical protein